MVLYKELPKYIVYGRLNKKQLTEKGKRGIKADEF